jgi:outer membrane biosynthesis protein TonB
MRRASSATLAALTVVLSTTSCASLFHRHPPEPAFAGVPIEKRPTPVPPDTTLAVETKPVPAPATPTAETEKPAPAPQPPPAPTPPVEAAMSPEERRASLQRIVADTTAASGAVSKCAGKDLLPDQQSVYETTRSLLSQTRVAIVREELWRAESLARKARQLALSLECH